MAPDTAAEPAEAGAEADGAEKASEAPPQSPNGAPSPPADDTVAGAESPVQSASQPMKRLTTEEIMAARDLREAEVEIAEWGGSVKIRTFSKGRQLEMREQATITNDAGDEVLDEGTLEVLTFIEAVVEPRFSYDQAEQLKEKSAAAIDRVIVELGKLGQTRPEDVGQAEARFQSG